MVLYVNFMQFCGRRQPAEENLFMISCAFDHVAVIDLALDCFGLHPPLLIPTAAKVATLTWFFAVRERFSTPK